MGHTIPYVLVAIGATLALAAWLLLVRRFVGRRKIDELLRERLKVAGLDPGHLAIRRPYAPRVIAALLQPVAKDGGYRDLPADSPVAWAEQLKNRLPGVYRATARLPNALIAVFGSTAIAISFVAATTAPLLAMAVILACVVPLYAAWRHRVVCEHALTELLSQVLAPPAPTPSGPARLEVVSGSDAAPFLLDRDVLVAGRAAPADIVLPSVTISRQHCRFTREGAAWIVEDLQSANGIKVNGQAGPRFTLKSGDHVEIGSVITRFVEGAPQAPPGPGVCPKCGRQNQPNWRFCLGCGAELPR